MKVFPSDFVNAFLDPRLDISVNLIHLGNKCTSRVAYEVIPWSKDVAWVFDFIQQGNINLMTIYNKLLGINRTFYINSTIFDLMISNYVVLSLDLAQLIIARVNTTRAFIYAAINMDGYNPSMAKDIMDEVRTSNTEFNEIIIQNAITDRFGSMAKFKESCLTDFSNYMASVVYIYNRSLAPREHTTIAVSVREWDKWLINKYKPKNNPQGIILE